MREKRVESVKDIDFTGLKVPYIAVYEHPDDYPKECVARVYDLEKPTNTMILKDAVDEIAKDITENTGMTFVPRGPEDVLSLVGIWI